MKKFSLIIIFFIHNPLYSQFFNSKQEEKILNDKLLASYTYAYMNCRINQSGIKKEFREKGITTTYQVAEEILENNYKLNPNLLQNEKVIQTAKYIERLIGPNCDNKMFLQSEEVYMNLINKLR